VFYTKAQRYVVDVVGLTNLNWFIIWKLYCYFWRIDASAKLRVAVQTICGRNSTLLSWQFDVFSITLSSNRPRPTYVTGRPIHVGYSLVHAALLSGRPRPRCSLVGTGRMHAHDWLTSSSDCMRKNFSFFKNTVQSTGCLTDRPSNLLLMFDARRVAYNECSPCWTSSSLLISVSHKLDISRQASFIPRQVGCYGLTTNLVVYVRYFRSFVIYIAWLNSGKS
jgi:hypothetical protein